MGRVACPRCRIIDQQKRVGHNSSGSQRYVCQRCGRKYTPAPNEQGYCDEIRRRAVEMVISGLSMRAVARELKISPQSVSNWMKAHELLESIKRRKD